MKELNGELTTILETMTLYSRKLALKNLSDRGFDISIYLESKINNLETKEDFRTEGFKLEQENGAEKAVYNFPRYGSMEFILENNTWHYHKLNNRRI